MKKTESNILNKNLLKSPTGIQGFDEITGGGLPSGRPTLICGGAGCGKTLFGIEFLVRGATQFNEPGVFMSFEETNEELVKNVASLGFDLENLVRQKKLHWTTFILSAVKSKKPVHTIWKVYSYDLVMPLIRSEPNVLYWIRLNHCLPGCQTS